MQTVTSQVVSTYVSTYVTSVVSTLVSTRDVTTTQPGKYQYGRLKFVQEFEHEAVVCGATDSFPSDARLHSHDTFMCSAVHDFERMACHQVIALQRIPPHHIMQEQSSTISKLILRKTSF